MYQEIFLIYVDKFYKLEIRQNEKVFVFDFFYIIKGIKLSVWKTKDLSVWARNLIKINSASIPQLFIDMMKYYKKV